MRVANTDDLKKIVEGCATVDGQVKVTDPAAFRGEVIDRLVYNAVFANSSEVRGMARWMIKSAAMDLGIWSASIQGLYEAMGRGDLKNEYTVPAVNIRGLSYDVGRALIRAAMKNNSGAFLIEIAKSEISYTKQRPAEYTTVMIAAAVKEGFCGPIFIQGDHFQVNAGKYKEDPAKEVQSVKNLIEEAIRAQFYNIDIDTSTLVDLAHSTLEEQQRLNYQVGAELTEHVRKLEPEGVTISVGGEIGEVGEKNSTVEELEAYMDGYEKAVKARGLVGISKVSVQTGTSHGGIPLPDGSVAEVALDFDTLDKLGATARKKYGLCGAVQHGASTLPDELFHRFPQVNTGEIHLATGFQNMIYDSNFFPASLKEKIYKGLHERFGDEMKAGQTEEQFIYKTRKKGFGLVKEELWTLPEVTRNSIGLELENKFDFLFKQLAAVNNTEDVAKHVVSAKIAPDLAVETEMA
ncbi:MAG: class II fructose-bisphosphate aldolase [Nitrospinota bacterium]|nr:class II fructose-bisphosphate aldolase [Nitrospinota bacterium]MDH5678806.1 class II fructose-bisphosphate aldolase [Nitrospinota bacterium]MDH5757021.1 class II fructose-bisphosphate aldolase [Nitrospinota bacterium]